MLLKLLSLFLYNCILILFSQKKLTYKTNIVRYDLSNLKLKIIVFISLDTNVSHFYKMLIS